MTSVLGTEPATHPRKRFRFSQLQHNNATRAVQKKKKRKPKQLKKMFSAEKLVESVSAVGEAASGATKAATKTAKKRVSGFFGGKK
jgi:hypothetical protein